MKDKQNAKINLGLLLEHVEAGYLSAILDGINAAVEEQDVNLLCFTGGGLLGRPNIPFDSQRNILYEMSNSTNVSGLIIMGSVGTYVSNRELRKFHHKYQPLPTVSIGTPLENIFNVVVDNNKGLRDALFHLTDVHNYKRIAFIRGPENVPEAQIRYDIYKDVLSKRNLPLESDLVTQGNFAFDTGSEAIRVLLDDRKVGFDVVVAANDNMALGALEELQARGILVPYKVAVVGFDDIKQSRNSIPSLTTVRQPLFEMGKQAVEILLSQIADEIVSEQVVLPTELIVRRSCGCFNIADTERKEPAKIDKGKSLKQTLITERETIFAELVQILPLSTSLASEWVGQILDSFFTDLKGESEDLFLSTLDKVLRLLIKKEGDLNSGQMIISILHGYMMSSRKDDNQTLQAERLLRKAQVFIGEEERKVWTQQIQRRERQNVELRTISQSLITTFDIEKLIEVIADSLPRLDIPSCYLVLYENPQAYSYPQPTPEWSRLILAYDKKQRMILESNGRRFRSHLLLPDGILAQNRRYTMIIAPLYFQDEQIGFILFERGQQAGDIYEILRGQISSALKGALLLKAHKQAEEKIRQHRDQLDELVQERTVELTRANEYLHQEIAERERIEEALIEQQFLKIALQKEQELSDLRNRYLSTIAHDFRTPLTSISLASNTLDKYSNRLNVEKRQIEFDRISRAVNYLDKMLDELGLIARAERGYLEFHPMLLNPRAIFTQMVNDFITSNEHNHEIILDVSDEIDVYCLDEDMLNHILQNLLSNAIKYSPEGGKIILSLSKYHDNLIIKITDEGIGIPEVDQAHLFKPFHRAQNVGVIKGSGIGLSIVKEMLTAHGGFVSYESTLGLGTTFTLTIPLKYENCEAI